MPRHGLYTNLTAETARALLRFKAYKLSAAQGVTACVDGFPNVGGNSLINALARAKVRHCVCPSWMCFVISV
jgi:ribosome biogenesis GTPase A